MQVPRLTFVGRRGDSCLVRQTRHRRMLCEQACAIVGDAPATDDDLAAVFVELGVPTKYLDSQVRYYWSEGYGRRERIGLRQAARPRAIASTVMSPAGHVCTYCGDPAEAIDHVWPRARGGDDHPNNLVRACQPCNNRKAARSLLGVTCPGCGQERDPGDVDTSTGTAYYHCRCGRSWSRRWDLQRVALVA